MTSLGTLFVKSDMFSSEVDLTTLARRQDYQPAPAKVCPDTRKAMG